MKKIFILMFFSWLIISCSHVNLLDDYDLSKKIIYFEELVGVNANEVIIAFDEQMTPAQTEVDAIKNVAIVIGGSILTSETEKKLRNASSPELIVKGISQGIETSMLKFLRIEPKHTLSDESEFLVTTTLEKCKLHSSNIGTFIAIEAMVQIFERNSGKLIWEYEDTESIGLRRSIIGSASNSAGMGNFSQVADLLSLSQEEIATAINDAAVQVGRNISEILREDISKSSH